MAKKREFEIADLSVREVKHQSVGRTSLILPGQVQFWKPKAEPYTVEFVAYPVSDAMKRYPTENQYAKPGQWYYERTYHTHRKIGVNGDSYVCPAKTFGKRCPICEEVSRLNRSSDKTDQERARELRASERQLFLIYDPDDRKNRGVYLWDVSTFNFGKQLDAFISGAREQDRRAYKAFFHPRNGLSVRITGEERKMPNGSNTVYSVNGFFPRESDVPDELFDHGFDLDAMPREVSYTELDRIFRGVVDGDEQPTDEDTDDRSREAVRSRRDEQDEDERPTRREESRSRERDEEPAPRRNTARVEEPPPKPEPVEFATNDTVSFEYKDQVVTGVIKKVNHEDAIAHIEVKGMDRLKIIDLSELTLVSADDTFDLKNPPADVKAKDGPVRAAPGKWDEPDADPEPPVKRGPGRPPKPRN